MNRSNFVYDIKMVSIIHNLMESTGKLLSRLDHSLDLDVGHFECLRESICFLLEHLEGSFDHVLLKLVVNDFDLTRCLIMSFENLGLLVRLH